MKRAIRIVAAAASLASAALTALLAALAMQRGGLPYENGRYFDAAESVVYDQGAVAVYALLALGSALVSALLIFATVRLWRRR